MRLTSSDIQIIRMACRMYTRLKATATAPMLRVSMKDFLQTTHIHTQPAGSTWSGQLKELELTN
jgi:hypothetical protein